MLVTDPALQALRQAPVWLSLDVRQNDIMKELLFIALLLVCSTTAYTYAEPLPSISMKIEKIKGWTTAPTEVPKGINVTGAVKNPGFIEVAERISMKDAIEAAGGMNRFTNKRVFRILDFVSGDVLVIRFPERSELSERSLIFTRIHLKPGDALDIPERHE